MPPPNEREDFARAEERQVRRPRGRGPLLGQGGEGRPATLGQGADAAELLGDGADGPEGGASPIRRSRGRRPGAPGLPPPPASTPSPFRAPGLWDTITINGVLFLGLATIDGETANALDVKHAKGRDGGSITDSGAVCAEPTITFRYWDEETYASWESVFAAIDPQRRVDRRNPIDVTHPALAQRGITRVYVKSVGFPKMTREGWTVAVRVVQWMPSLTAPRTGGSVTRTPAGPDISSNATAFSGLEDAPENQPPDPAITDSNP